MRTSGTNLHWSRPSRPCGTGVLVLAGSSGVLDVGRADVLARAGATALALRWFGGEGQPATPRRVPLETFTDAVDRLTGECDRLAVLGLSYGAEAALLTAVRDPRLAAVVALAPTDVVWEGAFDAPDEAAVSKWTWRGADVPFVPIDREWRAPTTPPAYVDLYRRSKQVAAQEVVDRAAIPAELIAADVVLVAGGDDEVWPSTEYAQSLAERRGGHGRPTTLVLDLRAGHPVELPGEAPRDSRRAYRVGGDAGAPQRLGRRAWPAIRAVLRLDETAGQPIAPEGDIRV